MTPEKKALIEEQAERYSKARDKFHALGMMNVGNTPEERIEKAKLYAVAEAEMLEEKARLEIAQRP